MVTLRGAAEVAQHLATGFLVPDTNPVFLDQLRSLGFTPSGDTVQEIAVKGDREGIQLLRLRRMLQPALQPVNRAWFRARSENRIFWLETRQYDMRLRLEMVTREDHGVVIITPRLLPRFVPNQDGSIADRVRIDWYGGTPVPMRALQPQDEAHAADILIEAGFPDFLAPLAYWEHDSAEAYDRIRGVVYPISEDNPRGNP